MRQAVLLVGGRGTRLGEAARDTPKPMMPIAGDVRFLDYLIENLARHGIEEVLLLAGHLAHKVIERYGGKLIRGARVEIILEPEPAGTAGALTYARDRLDDVFLMSNGDSFLDMNYLALAQSLGPNDMGALALRRVEDAGRFGRVSLESGRVTGFHEKDASWTGPALISGGVYVLRRTALALIDRLPYSIETDIFPNLARRGQLGGKAFDGFFIDIGLPETLAEGRATIPAQMRRRAVFFDRDGTLTIDKGYTHKIEDLAFQPGAVEAIRAVNDSGALAIIITNQAGIARGLYGPEAVDAFHGAMQAALRAQGAHIDAWYMCPFHEDGLVADYRRVDHPDRKPAPGMIRRALLEWPIVTEGSFVVGDRDIDAEAAVQSGLPGYLVKPGGILATVTQALAPTATSARTISETTAMTSLSQIKTRAAQAKSWLFDSALPLWWETGFDREIGLFHERINLDGTPALLPRRIRVQARQTFVYATAGRLGWAGPWREAANAGADALLARGFRADGGTIYSLDESGKPKDTRRDLYDVAFVVFALAHAGAVLQRKECLSAAESLLDWTYANWSHPAGGFLEGELTPVPPRRQNPHMHMLEALLAMYEATGNKLQLERAGVIARLFGTRFMSQRWGALLEYFDDAWLPAPGDEGRITEPGHQFEWSWLLDRYRRHSGNDVSAESRRAYFHGEVYGVDTSGVTVDEVWAEGGVRTPTSRFWPHTERIKANIIRVEASRDPTAGAKVVQAFDVLMSYCDVPVKGLWRDRRNPDGTFVAEAAPASSFYHAILAMSELIRVADSLDD
jgi:D,D-heptose 1,7-bisphosphate phosphatase